MAAAPAHAQDSDGKVQVKLLGSYVIPDGKTTAVNEDILGLPDTLQTEANENFVPTLALEYFVSPTFSVETICCMTQHDVDAVSGLPNSELVSDAKLIPATLTAKYHLDAGAVKPYVGAGATYFWSTSNNGQVLLALGNGIFQVQRQRVEIQGLELNLGVRLPIEGLRLSTGYAHLIGRYDSDTRAPDGIVDTDLDGTNISPDRMNVAADLASGPVTARVQTQMYFARNFRGKARPDPRNSFGGYTVTDASVRYQTRIGGFYLSAQNIFDRHYIDYNSDTRLPDDNLAFFAGRGRTFTLGWDMRF